MCVYIFAALQDYTEWNPCWNITTTITIYYSITIPLDFECIATASQRMIANLRLKGCMYELHANLL